MRTPRGVTTILLLTTLLNGICTQNCNTCQPQQQQPTYIAPQQLYFQAPLQRILYGPTGAFYSAGNSVVLTVPVATINRANPQQIARTGCCTPVASQPAWGQPQWPAQRTQPNYLVQAGNDNRPTTGVNYQNAIYTQATPRPVVNYTYVTSPGPAQVPPYNQANQGYPSQPSTPTPTYINPGAVNPPGYLPPPQTAGYNEPNQVYGTPAPGQGLTQGPQGPTQAPNYNTANQGYGVTGQDSANQGTNYNQANQNYGTPAPNYNQGSDYNNANENYGTPAPGAPITGDTNYTPGTDYNNANENYGTPAPGGQLIGDQGTNYNEANEAYGTPSPDQNQNYNDQAAGLGVIGAGISGQGPNYNGPNAAFQGQQAQGSASISGPAVPPQDMSANYNQEGSNYNQANEAYQGDQQQGQYPAGQEGQYTGGANYDQAGSTYNQEGSNYNDANQGYQDQNQGQAGAGVTPGYNAPNEEYQGQQGPGQGYQQQQQGAQGQAGNVQAPNYNGVNQPSGGPNNGEYTSTYEGTFFGPANQQQNTQGGAYAPLPYNEANLGGQGQGQGQYQQGQPGQQGAAGVAGAAAAGVLYPAAGELGNQGYQGGNQGYPQGQMNTGEANYQGGPAPQGNYQGNYQQANEQYPTQGPNQQGYQDQGQQGQQGSQQGQQGQQQQGFPYSTTNPNEGWAPTEAPTMSTAGYTPGQGDYTYSTTYNPNNQYQGGSTPMPDNGNVYVSPLYDGQGTQQGFQSTTPYPGSSQGYGVGGAVAAGAVAGAAAGAAAAGAAARTTTPSPYGQTADGQFVDQQYASTTPYPSNQQGYSTTMFPSTNQGQQYTGQPQNDQGFTGQGQGQQGQYASSTPGFTGQPQGQQGQYPSSTPGYGYTGQGQGQQGQYDSSTPGYDGAPTTNMNYQYSQGVGADGQTVTPFMGSSTQQPFAQTQNDFGGQQRDQSTTLSPQAQGSVNGRLYDHGDMNAVYGRYNNGTEITDSSSPAAIQRDQQPDDQTTQSTAATSSLLAAVLALIYVFTF